MPEVHYKKPPAEVLAIKPILTGLMLAFSLWSLIQSYSLGSPWLWHHAFSNLEFAAAWADHKYLQIFQMMFWATFTHINVWQLLGDAYFLWVFGSAVEQRLGQANYAVVILSSIIGGWLVLGFEAMSAHTTHFIGSGLLICGIIGAYVNFFPEKKINPMGTIGRGYKLYKNDPPPDPSKAFGVSPWTLISLFVIYQVGLHYWFTRLSLPVRFDDLTTAAPLAALCLGAAACYLIVVAATSNLKGDPLHRLALQRYQQLKRLDLTHEQCIEGTAKILNVPPEQVKEWVGKGALPHQLNH